MLCNKRTRTCRSNYSSLCSCGKVLLIGNIQFLIQVWRHGDRTPSVLLPTDPPNSIDSWPLGLGELTERGIQQEFNLGEFVRTRYDGFLAKDYSPFEVILSRNLSNTFLC